MTTAEFGHNATGACRAYWLAGQCPCCGESLRHEGLGGEQRAVIGEGVMICGWCVYRGHTAPDIAAAVLAAVATGIDP